MFCDWRFIKQHRSEKTEENVSFCAPLETLKNNHFLQI